MPLAYSPDGTKLATGSTDARNAEHTVKLWDVETGQNLTTLRGHRDALITIAYSRDGTLLASGSKDKTIKIWAVETEQNIATLQGHGKSVNSVGVFAGWDKTGFGVKRHVNSAVGDPNRQSTLHTRRGE